MSPAKKIGDRIYYVRSKSPGRAGKVIAEIRTNAGFGRGKEKFLLHFDLPWSFDILKNLEDGETAVTELHVDDLLAARSPTDKVLMTEGDLAHQSLLEAIDFDRRDKATRRITSMPGASLFKFRCLKGYATNREAFLRVFRLTNWTPEELLGLESGALPLTERHVEDLVKCGLIKRGSSDYIELIFGIDAERHKQKTGLPFNAAMFYVFHSNLFPFVPQMVGFDLYPWLAGWRPDTITYTWHELLQFGYSRDDAIQRAGLGSPEERKKRGSRPEDLDLGEDPKPKVNILDRILDQATRGMKVLTVGGGLALARAAETRLEKSGRFVSSRLGDYLSGTRAERIYELADRNQIHYRTQIHEHADVISWRETRDQEEPDWINAK